MLFAKDSLKRMTNCTRVHRGCPAHIYCGISVTKYPYDYKMPTYSNLHRNMILKPAELLKEPDTNTVYGEMCELACYSVCAGCQIQIFSAKAAGICIITIVQCAEP